MSSLSGLVTGRILPRLPRPYELDAKYDPVALRKRRLLEIKTFCLEYDVVPAGGNSFNLRQLRDGSWHKTMKELTTDYDLGISRLDVNILDHAEYYRSRIKPYGPAAIVAHLYVIDHGVFAGDRPFKCCAKVAAEYDLRCIRLPWSWYEPTACMPVLYLRKRTT